MPTTPRKADPEVPPPPMKPEPDPAPAPAPAYKYTLINPGNATIVYDSEGHTLSGGESVQLNVIEPIAQNAIDRGYLTLIVN